MCRRSEYSLVGDQKHRFQRELALRVVEQVLKTRAEEIHNHDVIVALSPVPIHVRNPDYGHTLFLLPPCKSLYSFVSYISCGCLDLVGSYAVCGLGFTSLIATSSFVLMLVPSVDGRCGMDRTVVNVAEGSAAQLL